LGGGQKNLPRSQEMSDKDKKMAKRRKRKLTKKKERVKRGGHGRLIRASPVYAWETKEKNLKQNIGRREGKKGRLTMEGEWSTTGKRDASPCEATNTLRKSGNQGHQIEEERKRGAER